MCCPLHYRLPDTTQQHQTHHGNSNPYAQFLECTITAVKSFPPFPGSFDKMNLLKISNAFSKNVTQISHAFSQTLAEIQEIRKFYPLNTHSPSPRTQSRPPLARRRPHAHAPSPRTHAPSLAVYLRCYLSSLPHTRSRPGAMHACLRPKKGL